MIERKTPVAKDNPSLVKRRLRSEESDTRLRAAVILEVLAGERSTADAAEALGVTVPRYYSLEARAIEGLVIACRRKPRGPPPSIERELKKLSGEVKRLEVECARQQALLRAAQRTLGVKPPPKPDAKPPAGKKRRRKRPAVRALRAVEMLSGGDKLAPRGGEAEGSAGGA